MTGQAASPIRESERAIGPAQDAMAAFVGKWQLREPEMRIAEAFCAADALPVFRAWGALLHELREAVFDISEAQVSLAKSTWWAGEMLDFPQGQSRHPIGVAFAGVNAPWPAMARAWLALRDCAPRPRDASDALASLMPAANATIAVESILFGVHAGDDAATSLARHWLLHRLPAGMVQEDQARIPMHLIARHAMTPDRMASGDTGALMRDWSGELAMATPTVLEAASYFRRARHRFDQARLDRLARGGPAEAGASLATLWRAWQAARHH